MFGRGIELKTTDELAVMREAGLVVAAMLQAVRSAVAPGVTTGDLDALAREVLAEHGATSNFLGYGAEDGVPGFAGVICTSVDDEVVHGIPGRRVLREGDVVSIDAGAVIDGWHGDAATTIAVGEVTPDVAGLLRASEQALEAGIAAGRLGGRVGDISAAIEQSVRGSAGLELTDGYTGHGIGSAMHQPPDVPNVGRAGRGARIVPGLVLAIEPMVTLGTHENRTLDDGWTVVTTDGSWASHHEHSVTWTEDGPWVLTAPAGPGNP